MTDPEVAAFVLGAEEFYANNLREFLEPQHVDEFVAIEPESGDYFLGKTMSEASAVARKTYPDRLTHVMRVGHRAALHFGMQVR
jgi:hypothetical protein